MPKIALVIPSYIKANSPHEVLEADGFRLLERTLASLKTLKGQDIDVILPFCIEGKGIIEGRYQEYHLALMKALSTYPLPFKRFVLTAYNLKTIKEYLLRKGFGDDNII